jgi:hypothetical protein
VRSDEQYKIELNDYISELQVAGQEKFDAETIFSAAESKMQTRWSQIAC